MQTIPEWTKLTLAVKVPMELIIFNIYHALNLRNAILAFEITFPAFAHKQNLATAEARKAINEY